MLKSSQLTSKNLLAVLFVGATWGCSSSISVKVEDSRRASATAPATESDTGSDVEIEAMSAAAAKPGQVVDVSGQNFRLGMAAVVNGVSVNLQVTSPTKASFTMPEGAGIGLIEVSFSVDGKVVKTLSLISDSAGDGLPIIVDAPEHVCSELTFRNTKGEITKGLRGCTDSAILAECAQDGQINCRANDTYKVALIAGLASKMVLGQTGAGVAGTVISRPANCAADGATDCVANLAYKAAAAAGLDSKVMVSGTVAGVAGIMPAKPSDCAADGAVDCVTTSSFKAAKVANFSGTDIRTGVQVAGVTGSMVAAPAACATDGATGCYANAAYTAAATTGLASKVLATTTVAGIVGNVTLPSASNVLASASFGVSSATSGTVTNCAANGSGCYLVAYTGTSNHFKAIDYDNINTNKSKIRTGLTLSGIAGTLADCADGGSDCVAVSPTFAAATIAGSAAKILTGQSVAGINGSASVRPADCAADGGVSCVTVANFPAVDKVNTLQANAAKIRSSLTIASVAGTLADCAATGSSCYVPAYVLTTQPLKAINFDSITPAVVKKNTLIAGVTGDYPSATNPLPGSGDSGVATDLTSFAAQLVSAGSFQFWDSTGARHTGSGDPDIAHANVKKDVVLENLGITGSAAIPDPWDVRVGSAVGSATGKLKMNCRNGGSTLTFGVGTTKTATVTSAADTLTITGHGFSATTPVQISYATQPTGLALATDYYVIVVDNDTIKLAATVAQALAASAIDITADGTGVIAWLVGGTPKAANVDNTTEQLTVIAHGLTTGQFVKLSATTPPTGLALNTYHPVIVVDANTIKLASTYPAALAGSAINITADGSDVYVFTLGTGTLSVTDTITDWNNGAGVTAHPWGSENYFCGGIATTAADDNVWLDVSTSGCAANPSGCRMKDKISGLTWSKLSSPSLKWFNAGDYCKNLTHDSVGGWRLPTIKEALGAYINGMFSTNNANWLTATQMALNPWTATVNSGTKTSAWFTNLSTGIATASNMANSGYAICVK